LVDCLEKTSSRKPQSGYPGSSLNLGKTPGQARGDGGSKNYVIPEFAEGKYPESSPNLGKTPGQARGDGGSRKILNQVQDDAHR
jgi:hypothetical protein